MKMKMKSKKMKVVALLGVACMSFCMFCGFTYPPDDISTMDDMGVAVADIDDSTGDIIETSYDIGQAVYEYDDVDTAELTESSYAPVISPTDSITISASVVYPDTSVGEVGYMQIIAKTPSDSVFANYDEAIIVASDIEADEPYTGSYTFENLEAGDYEFLFMFYSGDDDVAAVYSACQSVLVTGSITEMSTISSVNMYYGSCKTVSFTCVSDENMGDLSYEWYVDDVKYSTTSVPAIDLCSLAVGEYVMYCDVVPEVGVATETNKFNVKVIDVVSNDDVTIVSPSDIEVTVGEPATVSVLVSAPSDSEISYTWYIDSSKIDESNTQVITFANLPEGEYDVYCVVTVNDESIESSVATISILEDTTVVTDPDTDTDTDTDTDADEDEEANFFTKAGDWCKENTIIVIILALGGAFVIYKFKR